MRKLILLILILLVLTSCSTRSTSQAEPLTSLITADGVTPRSAGHLNPQRGSGPPAAHPFHSRAISAARPASATPPSARMAPCWPRLAVRTPFPFGRCRAERCSNPSTRTISKWWPAPSTLMGASSPAEGLMAG